ncbi:hypothetical protein ABVT39_024248 [Epinephelus coioides]
MSASCFVASLAESRLQAAQQLTHSMARNARKYEECVVTCSYCICCSSPLSEDDRQGKKIEKKSVAEKRVSLSGQYDATFYSHLFGAEVSRAVK